MSLEQITVQKILHKIASALGKVPSTSSKGVELDHVSTLMVWRLSSNHCFLAYFPIKRNDTTSQSANLCFPPINFVPIGMKLSW
jgi:hypothetical protein